MLGFVRLDSFFCFRFRSLVGCVFFSFLGVKSVFFMGFGFVEVVFLLRF